MSDSAQRPDKDLARRTASVGQLLIREEIRVKAYILSVLRDSEAADDVFQQVAVTALEKADQFELGTNFRSWAVSIARFACLEYLRKNSRKTFAASELIDLLADEASGIEDTTQHLVSVLYDCLNQVPPDSRQVLYDRYVEGKPVDKIAAAVRRTVQATYALIKRLKAKLRDCVATKTNFRVVPAEEGNS